MGNSVPAAVGGDGNSLMEIKMELNQEIKNRILWMWDRGAGVDDIAGDIDIDEEIIVNFLRDQGQCV